MSLQVYNTLTQKIEEFAPLDPGKIGMYVCGVTNYDDCHLGHARCYVVFDVVRRYLGYGGYEVNHVQNFTDVDDKIINRSAELGISTRELTEKYETRYFEMMDRLNVRRASRYPRATGEIPEMLKLIGQLIEKGHAYESAGDVYFSWRSFKSYGKLSKRDEESMQAGARVEISDRKKDPLDFTLWKRSKPGEPEWESPWGRGRPGWHIECSAMAMKYIGQTLDIHGGGQDLIFPHHENEIAQSEAVTGKPFVRYFLHNGFITTEGAKMSKSLGNFKTLVELFKVYDPRVIRFYILTTHYRSPLLFTAKKLEDAAAGLARLREGFRNLDELLGFGAIDAGAGACLPDMQADLPDGGDTAFREAMDYDFNTANGLGVIFKNISAINGLRGKYIKSAAAPPPVLDRVKECAGWLKPAVEDVMGMDVTGGGAVVEPRALELAKRRDQARAQKNYKEADRIRAELVELGYQVQDTPQGTRISK